MSANLLLLFVVLGVINLSAFILVGIDKNRSVDQARRLPEVFLFFAAACAAAFGVFLGMLFFRHKTRKVYFLLGVGLLLIQQTVLAYLLGTLFLGK